MTTSQQFAVMLARTERNILRGRSRSLTEIVGECCKEEVKLHENNSAVGAVGTARPERNQVSALDGAERQRRSRKGSVVVHVTLVACRCRLLDDDNLVYSLKPLRDAVAASLGLDDRDARIRFGYGQARTDGEEGVIVKIETGSDL